MDPGSRGFSLLLFCLVPVLTLFVLFTEIELGVVGIFCNLFSLASLEKLRLKEKCFTFDSLAWSLGGILSNLHIKGTLLEKEPLANMPKI